MAVEERHESRGGGWRGSNRAWFGALLALFALRSALGAAIPGFLTGDDVEILEQGFRRVFGLEVVVWELRNTLVAELLVVPALWVAAALGVRDPGWLCWAATVPFTLLSVASVALLAKVVRAWSGDRALAVLAALLYALHWMPFGYAGTVYPRTASTTCVLAALALLASRRSASRGFAAGALAALAFAFRYSEIVFLPAMLAISATGRAGDDAMTIVWRRIGAVAAGFAAGVVAFVGFHDLATWARPFASLLEFARYTLIENQASSFETNQPWFWYLWRIPKWLDPAALLLVLVAARRRSLPWAWIAAGIPLLLLSIVHHKQLRYLQGVIPFVCVLAAAGALSLRREGRKRTATLLVLASLLLSLAPLRFLARKSSAAVAVAQEMAADPTVRVAALEQAWAYGGRIYLGPSITVRNLDFAPAPGSLERAIEGADRVALYADSLRADPELEAVLERNDFRERSSHEGPPGRRVVVFERCPEPAKGSELATRCWL